MLLNLPSTRMNLIEFTNLPFFSAKGRENTPFLMTLSPLN